MSILKKIGLFILFLLLVLCFGLYFWDLKSKRDDNNWYEYRQILQTKVDDFNDAIKKYDVLLAKKNLSRVLRIYVLKEKSLLLYHLEDYEKSIYAYRQCINLKPNIFIQPLIYVGLLTVYMDAGLYDEATELCEGFLSKFPNHYLTGKIYYLFGIVSELNHDIKGANRNYSELISNYEDTLWSNKATVRYSELNSNKILN